MTHVILYDSDIRLRITTGEGREVYHGDGALCSEELAEMLAELGHSVELRRGWFEDGDFIADEEQETEHFSPPAEGEEK